MKRSSRRAQKGYLNDKQNEKKKKNTRVTRKKKIINTAEKKER